MRRDIRFVGLDVHPEAIAVAVAEPGGEVRALGTVPNTPEAIRRLVKKLGPSERLRTCYEAGPTGYALYWQLTGLGVHCDIVAPTLVPVNPGGPLKTDRRDAEKLARSYRSGDLTPVWVPDAALFARSVPCRSISPAWLGSARPSAITCREVETDIRQTVSPGRRTRRLICLVKVDHRVYRNIPPLGLLYLGDALKKAGYDVEVHHILDDEIEACAERILVKSPLFVGFSVVTGWGIKPAAELSRMIKQAGTIPVVWGNVHPSHLPEQCLAEDYIDIVCIGEGEETVVELARALESRSALGEIPGIGYKDNGRIVVNARRPHAEDLDRYEADWSLVDINRYIAPCWGIQRTLRVTASRGCPFNCSFCYNQAFNRRRWRRHSAGYVLSRLTAWAREADIAAFYFNDDNFFVDKAWAWSILEGIERPYYVSVRPELIDEDFARHLAETGCKELLVGFESGSDAVLKEVLNKGCTVEDNLNAIRCLSRHPEIQVTASFMAGLPGETEEDFRQTVEMVCECLEAHPTIRIIMAFYRPMPGTDLYRVAVDAGFKPPATTEEWSAYDALSNTLDLPWVDAERSRRIQALCQAMDILAALYKFKIPLLTKVVRNRVLSGDCDNWLVRGVNRIRVAYAFGDGGRLSTRVLRRVVDAVKQRRNLD